MQPMVTIDYTIDEYSGLIKKIAGLQPDAVSIVDSFGYMLKYSRGDNFQNGILSNSVTSFTTADRTAYPFCFIHCKPHFLQLEKCK